MKYKGIELTPITTPHIFNPPKEMLVWDDDDDEPVIREVWGIAPPLACLRFPVISIDYTHRYCAEIPQTEPKRATNIQLAEWLARGNGMWKIRNSNQTFINASFDIDMLEEEVEAFVIIRPFGTKEWIEATLENMGLEE